MSSWELSRLPPFCRFSSTYSPWNPCRGTARNTSGTPAVGDVVHDEVPGIRRSLPPVEKGFLLFRLGRAGGPLLRLCRGRHHLPARAMVEEFCKGAGIAHCVASPGVLGCFRMRHICRSERPYLRARMATNALSLCPFPASSSRSIFRDELRLSSIAFLRLGM